MSASEIRQWAGIDDSADAIEAALLSLWEAHASGQIRPAKYPSETNLFRLWGHEEVVGRRDRTELEPRRLGDAIALEPLKSTSFVAEVFLSFSNQDYDLALNVRRYLDQQQVRCWMYQAILNQQLIVEGVREAMMKCDAVLALLTCYSLGSAWVYSEIHSASLDIGKPIYALIDSSDENLLQLVRAKDTKEDALPRHLVEHLLSKYRLVASDGRAEKYERILSDQIVSMRYCYAGAALFPAVAAEASSEKAKMFMDLPELVDSIKHAAAEL